ncbi:MAG: thiamine pyrophosphate-binding protein [Candidatus Margulisiibacteriota bacterium]|jgi:indolepyruvate decarboxylase
MKIGEYLIKVIQETGTKHVFGIQGDYVLNFYSQLWHSSLKVINTCTEQGAGFAADAYARITGFGVVCVTYGVGGLNLVNSTAQAFAEFSPVLIISGAPGISERQQDQLLHHKIRSFDTQLNIFKEVTIAQAFLENSIEAASEINRVINAIKKTRRPGYIEIPRDIIDQEIIDFQAIKEKSFISDPELMHEASQEIFTMIANAKQPVIIAGVELHRFGLQELFLEFLDCSRFPFVTGILGKSVISENHPQFIGVYAGAMTPDDVRQTVEDSDCIIAIGPLVTDLATGIFSHKIDYNKVISLNFEKIIIKHQVYQNIDLKSFLEILITDFPKLKKKIPQFKKHELELFVVQKNKKITVERLISCVNTFIDDNTTIIAEAGDALFAALDLTIHENTEFIAAGYYASLGFAIPAAVGVQLANLKRRPLVLIGDGSFQMSAVELSVVVANGLNPIIIILNNGGYGIFRPMIDGAFNDIHSWQYADFVKIIGSGVGYTVSNEEALFLALESAKKNVNALSIIDVKLDKNDFSLRLKKLTENLKRKVVNA